MCDLNEARENVLEHSNKVKIVMTSLIQALEERADTHDHSKLSESELPRYAAYLDRMRGVKFGSSEYHKIRLEFSDAHDLHYSRNRHHPEHFERGINGMNLIDIIEMLCDWKVASVAYGGNVRISLEIQKKALGISDQLASILLNTIDMIGETNE